MPRLQLTARIRDLGKGVSSEKTGDNTGKRNEMGAKVKGTSPSPPAKSLFMIQLLVPYSLDLMPCIFRYLFSIEMQMPSGLEVLHLPITSKWHLYHLLKHTVVSVRR